MHISASKLALTIGMATSVFAGPLVTPRNTLNARSTAYMNIAYCNSCLSNGESIVCRQDPYVHLGNSGEGSCGDGTAPFEADLCRTFGTIPTPYGDGNWEASDTCTDQSASGQSGTIKPADGSSSWECICDHDQTSFDVSCGQQFVCSQVHFCTCTGP